tara:strand:+ start:692 stop:1480 length:789 start_codon:yes stop_codon:yes gene_type:complete
MHEFQNKWLNLRETVDRNSRNKRILYLINKFFKNKKNIRIVDLGSGAGSNYRFLKSRLLNNQYWSFVDISHQSTNYFKKNIKLSSKIKKTNFKIVDVINNLEKINFNDYNLVTGSAFLDILPKTWFKNFHKLNVDTEIVYFALNYNGNFKFFPKHKDDKRILNIFNKDQKSDKGIGEVAVGPDCTELINKVFKRTHKTYVLDSTWDVSKNYEFQIYFLNFCREIIQKNKLNFDDWLKFRLKSIKEKNSRFILNNTDFLAIKK